MLIDGSGRPSGIIDWGDVHLGERAVDLSVAYGLFDAHTRRSFWSAYGPVSPATRDRARFRSLHSSLCLLHYGHAVGDGFLESPQDDFHADPQTGRSHLLWTRWAITISDR